jgi:hypothetical protein
MREPNVAVIARPNTTCHKRRKKRQDKPIVSPEEIQDSDEGIWRRKTPSIATKRLTSIARTGSSVKAKSGEVAEKIVMPACHVSQGEMKANAASRFESGSFFVKTELTSFQ